MKRTPKPFAVEVKRSRVPGRDSNPSKRLFGAMQAEVDKLLHPEKPETPVEVSEPTKPVQRVLPSLAEAARMPEQPVKRVRQKRSRPVEAEPAPAVTIDDASIDEVLEVVESEIAVDELADPSDLPEFEPEALKATIDPASGLLVPPTRSSKARRDLEAIASLPRGERWKRRLNPAIW
ncbi:hypothetical protein [Microvirga tunisiensis]|uniref:Uncharacterized protein n=1 Tax=Microvirga tunisiensis TaxID=2108360 RepID=A0A5N7MNW0_9HYPH|nr:hypothetical protein [Microvirga tunisiensis]MPR10133.1 hypothetical protein [Microvirga tunisiensis]MPR28340.1 hypothetical protein [Microvirga tunisiensis]